MTDEKECVEKCRLRDREAPWKKWGPYLSERQWGTVREDYSDNGNAWEYFTHDQARSRAYRWGEDGLAGISDDHQQLCFAVDWRKPSNRVDWHGRQLDPVVRTLEGSRISRRHCEACVLQRPRGCASMTSGGLFCRAVLVPSCSPVD